MVAFVDDYAETLTSDPSAAWNMLTPGFQAESESLEKYLEFWKGLKVMRLSDVVADPSGLTVSYHVGYSPPRREGLKEDDVTLQLVQEGDSFLIDGEFG